ncbi:MAG: ATP-binding cassette domain-containing protein [Pseudobdellovibrionaceae bacterium]
MKNQVIVDDLSFSLEQGQVISLLGPNGAGKTTVFEMILQHQNPSSGKIELQARLTLGYSPQTLQFPNTLLVCEVLHLTRLAMKTESQNLDHLCEQFDVKKILNQRIGTLSGGELRKISLIISFLGNHDVVILDEPTTGLDSATCDLLWKWIHLQKSKGISFLLTTHNAHEIHQMTDQVILLQKGKVQYQGDLKGLGANIPFKKISYRLSSEPQMLQHLFTTEIEKTVQQLLSENEIQDLTVEHIPIEVSLQNSLKKAQSKGKQ